MLLEIKLTDAGRKIVIVTQVIGYASNSRHGSWGLELESRHDSWTLEPNIECFFEAFSSLTKLFLVKDGRSGEYSLWVAGREVGTGKTSSIDKVPVESVRVAPDYPRPEPSA